MKIRRIIITIFLAMIMSINGQFVNAPMAEASGWGGALLGILSSWVDGGRIDPVEMRKQHDSMIENFDMYMDYRLKATVIGMDLLRSGGVEVVQAESVKEEFLEGGFLDGLGESAKEMAKIPKYKFDGTSYKVFCDRLRDANDPELRYKAAEFMEYIRYAHKYRDRMNDNIGYILSKTIMANDRYSRNRENRDREIAEIIRDAQYMKSYERELSQRGFDFNAMKREMDEAIKVR